MEENEMGIRICQEEKIWRVDVNEAFAFEDVEVMKKFVADFLEAKSKHAQLFEMKKRHAEVKKGESLKESMDDAVKFIDVLQKKVEIEMGNKGNKDGQSNL